VGPAHILETTSVSVLM